MTRKNEESRIVIVLTLIWLTIIMGILAILEKLETSLFWRGVYIFSMIVFAIIGFFYLRWSYQDDTTK